MIVEMTNAYKILVGNPEGRSRRWWKDNIRMYPREVGWEVVDWMNLA
jgi:hypothetical protein